MDCAKLDELIKIQKKSDASNSVKEEYKKEIATLLIEEGISDCSMKYVYSGFSFCGATPLYDYLEKSGEERMIGNLKSAFSYESLSKNENGIALRMALHLLYYTLSHGAGLNEATIFLLNTFNRNSKSKEGGFRKDLSKVVEKYFVNCISSDNDLSGINPSDTDDTSFVEFKTIMVYAMNGIKPQKAKTKRSLEIVRIWLGNVPSLDPNLSGPASVDELAESSESDVLMSESDMIKTIEYLSNSMPEYQSVLVQLLLRYKKLIELKSEIDDYRAKLEQADERIETYKNSLKAANEQIDALTSQKHSLMFQVTEMTEKISALNADNERLKKIMSVYSIDKADSQSEQLNAIASRLKSEYKDFKEAEDMEMTIDLGENLRVQMRSVFKILSKSGIDVEGR